MSQPPQTPPPSPAPDPVQRVMKVRRDYNTWVANETLEDYALRFTPHGARRWTAMKVANTAFGGAASFLVLEAVGATMLVDSGFINAFWAILMTGLFIFLMGLPISYYAARYGVDMDLLTRGAGFGYLGSTITSLIYASFTFIFFALEAAIMAYALELFFHIPPAWGYLLCALLIIPLVTHGITAISKLQAITLPLWVLLLVLPYVFLLWQEPETLAGLWRYPGIRGDGGGFDPGLFCAALTVGMALITQMGEQADYLRFMPPRNGANRKRWWLGLVMGGPGWVFLGVPKMLGGALLAYLALRNAIPAGKAVDPNQMYLIGFSHVFPNTFWALAATAAFVILSQLKINVTNAYAGSLAWSNFFARLTHSHPGRVVWMVFNTLIALMLMEMDVFQALGQVLGLYSNIAISWMTAVVADLVINKPLRLSPPGIEFKRGHLYDINPVGVGAMALASLCSVAVFVGLFGPGLRPYACLVAAATALITSPLLAWLTGGRYYLARQPEAAAPGHQRCCICDNEYESQDMAWCPAYQGPICSLCCSLDARCNDLCKPHARLGAQWSALLARLLPPRARRYLETGLGHYLLLMAGILPALAALLGLLYYHEYLALAPGESLLVPRLQQTFLRVFAALTLVSGIVAWWLVLTHKSRKVAQEESNRQTHLLMREIESHRRTDELLQRAKAAAEQANQAKTRYITAISHELRTPLNSILGYAQILEGDESIPPQRQQAVQVIRRSGDHLLSVIEGTLDIARIESGKMSLDVRPLDFPPFIQQIVGMFELQARNKGLTFRFEQEGHLPARVRADEQRLRQILINILGNGVKFTRRGEVVFHLRYRQEMARFEIRDSGPGIAPAELARIFEPFERGSASRGGAASGSGVGLTIAKMLTDLMGGEMTVESQPGQGTTFRIRLFLPRIEASPSAQVEPVRQPVGYKGIRRRILVVDNERVDRELLANVLEPLGFQVEQAGSGLECLERVADFQPHLIFLDLAMPGIDGWETLARLRREHLSDAPVAIISANAYEKGLGGLEKEAPKDRPEPEEFFLKPIKVAELLAWIGHRLDLEWVTAPQPLAPPPPPTAPQPLLAPPPEDLRALRELVELGYPRGLKEKLRAVAADHPQCAEFVRVMEDLARRFQFEAMLALLLRELEGPQAAAPAAPASASRKEQP